MSRVLYVTQSPMNARRWCLDLHCGHEVWVTGKRKPTRKSHPCDTCSAKRRAELEDK